MTETQQAQLATFIVSTALCGCKHKSTHDTLTTCEQTELGMLQQTNKHTDIIIVKIF